MSEAENFAVVPQFFPELIVHLNGSYVEGDARDVTALVQRSIESRCIFNTPH